MAAPSTKGQVRRNTISNAGRVKSFVDEKAKGTAPGSCLGFADGF
jgi:hypothetical protein